MKGVRVAKIRNVYIFKHRKGADPHGFHHYLIYHDKYSGENVAVQTSHLYLKDSSRFSQLRSGKGMKLQLPGFETPSMVMKKSYITDSKDKPLDFANRNVHVKARLSKSKARKVYRWMNNRKK